MENDRKAIIARYKKLYTGIVSDAMDKMGMRSHLLPYYLRPLKEDMVVAGFAFTGHGEISRNTADNDNPVRFSMLESIRPDDVPVWDCGGSMDCAHWGGMMTRSTRQAGGIGAVIDGGVRDVNDIVAQGFPVFYKFYSAGSSIGRWNIISYQQPITIGGVEIHPGDFIYGDIDGVLVVPADKIVPVLEKAEAMAHKEDQMGADMDKNGLGVRAAFDKYGTI